MNLITVCHNRWHHLKESLPTWRAIPAVNIYVVTYDAPPEPYPDVTFVKVVGEPFNICRARNAGLLASNRLTKSISTIFIDADVKLLNPNLFNDCPNDLFATASEPYSPHLGGTCVVNTRLAFRVCGYDERFTHTPGFALTEDTHFYNRLARAGGSMIRFNSHWLSHIEHPTNCRYEIGQANKHLYNPIDVYGSARPDWDNINFQIIKEKTTCN